MMQFTDDDKTEHLAGEYQFNIAKKWPDEK